jgi:hypothetical protein
MIFSKVWTRWTRPETPGSGSVICVYQGTQPTLEEYITNYNSSYSLAGPNILQLIFKSNNGVFLEINPDGSDYTQALKSFRSGTGTWASIHYIYGGDGGDFVAEYNISGFYFLSDNKLSTIQYLISENIDNYNLTTIVPISDLTDNGVIKFRSTTFNHPDESDEERVIDMSIVIGFKEQS